MTVRPKVLKLLKTLKLWQILKSHRVVMKARLDSAFTEKFMLF